MANRVNQRKGLAAWPEIPSCQIYPLVAVMFNHRKVCKCECWSPLAMLQLLVGSGNLKSLEPTVWIPYGVRLLNRYCIYCILRYSLFAILQRVYCHNCMQVSPFGQVIPSVWFFFKLPGACPSRTLSRQQLLHPLGSRHMLSRREFKALEHRRLEWQLNAQW